MPKTITVGKVSAAPGQLRWGNATYAELRDGTRVYLPVMVMNGAKDGPLLTVSGSTHATEQIGTHAIQLLLREKVDPAKLKGGIIGFPIANPFGMQFSEYVSPHDGVNMGRAYPGSKDGTVTQRFANFIWEEAAKKSDAVIDQHENAKDALSYSIVFDAKDAKTEKAATQLAEAFGVTVIKHGAGSKRSAGVYSWKAGQGLSSMCMSVGIPAFTPEYETTTDVRFNETDPGMRVALRGITNVLKKLGMLAGKIERQTDVPVLRGKYEGWGMPVCKRGGLTRRLVRCGEKVKKGTAICRIYDAFGNVVETITMPVDGFIWGWNVGVPPWWNWSVASGDPICWVFRQVG